MSPALEREVLLPRIDGIRKNVQRLTTLAALPLEQFCTEDPYALAQHHLRLALEGVFHIGSHILSRLPGGRAVEYKEIARKLGECGVVPPDFAGRALVAMAGMRNMLVHQYADIDAKRLHAILVSHLGDFDFFLTAIKDVIAQPKKFGLSIA